MFVPVAHGPLALTYLWAGLSVEVRKRPVGEQRGKNDKSIDAHIASLAYIFFFYFSIVLGPKAMYM